MNAMNEQTDRGPLLQRQHAVQQGNLSSAAQRMAQPTANEGFQLQSSLPYGNNPYSRAGFAGEHNGIAMPMVPDESGEKLPLFYWWGLAAWNKTRGTARVDLMRPRFPDLAPGNSLFHAAPKRGRRRSARVLNEQQFATANDTYDYSYGQGADTFGLLRRPTGARVKIMRSIQIGNFKPKQSHIHDEHMQKEYQSRPLVNSSARTPTHASASTQDIKGRAEQKLPHRTHLLSDGPSSQQHSDAAQIGEALRTVQAKLGSSLTAPQRPLLDLGVGLSYELDTNDFAAVVRLKVKDWFSIRALPNQIVKVNKRWQLGNSPVALRVNYECPLDNLANPLRAPARLMVRMENVIGRSVHLTPSGIDFDEHVFQLGQGTVVRAAGSLIFPRQLPVEEDERLVKFKAQRFGLKALW
ncbi:g1869 [Coccomyxa viridis]|uniref:G1869 protein n=1 Tax=Coccomyxa viridis TaxID=1274662 RepID=A0ABP1FPF7_9CHLO